MNILQATGRKRETYEVRLTYSPLWESALGIAAITNTKILDTLEKPENHWEDLRKSLSGSLNKHLDYVKENNTWKALLQLLHEYEGESIKEFNLMVESLEEEDMRFICLPFTGINFERVREKAAAGNDEAIKKLVELTNEKTFFAQYIEYISHVDIKELKTHLTEVMTLWFKEVIRPKLKEINQILRTDYEAKVNMIGKMSAEELVQWATGGINYLPEPSVHKVLLIPQYMYRPWNIEADIKHTKVFYYPVANESLSPEDKYMPNNFLVLKHKALGDETRLRIVKMLSERDHSLQELTDKLHMGKSTIHHHLKILRAAKLVEKLEGKYCLKDNVLNLLNKELEQYIQQ